MTEENDLDYPWVEEFRPKTIDDVIIAESLKTKLNEFLKNGSISHLLLVGDAGTGKTTIAKILAKHICGEGGYLYINASDRNNIETVRNDVTSFCSVTSFNENIKIIILDECDGMTPAAQKSLRSVMEEYAKNTRFILTANYIQKIITPLQSRCQTFEFFAPDKEDIIRRLYKIAHIKNIIPKDSTKELFIADLKRIAKETYPDIRLAINTLQKFTTNGKFTFNEEHKGSAIKAQLIEYIKLAKLRTIREEILSTNVDYPMLYGIIYDNMKEITTDIDRNSQITIVVAEYLWRHSQHLNPEMNFVACLMQIIAILQGKG